MYSWIRAATFTSPTNNGDCSSFATRERASLRRRRPNRISDLISIARGALWHCHENVTQIAENTGKCEATGNKRRRKRFAKICSNLLISCHKRRLWQDLVKLISRLRTRRSGVRISPGAPLLQSLQY